MIRRFSQSVARKSDFSHVVVGGGVVGTSIANQLQQNGPGAAVLLIEQHDLLGSETSSRNSEVIHAGLYYPKDSLKGQLCILGKQKLYEAYKNGTFSTVQVPLAQCGKWVVAQEELELEYLEKLHKHALDVGVPTNMVPLDKARVQNPRIRAKSGVLESPTTGIILVHDLVYFYETKFSNANGTLSLKTKLENIQFNQGYGSYTLELSDENGDRFEITADNVVNAAGLHAPKVSNLLLPKKVQGYYAKGTYYSYLPAFSSKGPVADKLIYPCPNPNASSLGTHLTFDLGGSIRFGPDLEWLEDIKDPLEIDYTVSTKRVELAYNSIKLYFPEVTLESLLPTYSGVRPKVVSREQNMKGFADFVIREEAGFPGFVNLLGIESPGVTASWAIGEYVRDIYYK